jgi:hypothetical protein
MRAIRDLADHPLHWRRGTLHTYRLEAGEEALALVSFERLTDSAALAETAEGCFSFQRRGVWQPQVFVHRCGADEELAVFEPHLWNRDGMLIGLHGPRFRWSHADQPQAGWRWQELTGRPLLHFSQVICSGERGMAGLMSVEPTVTALDALPLLATLGWYLLVLYERGTTRPLPEIHAPPL